MQENQEFIREFAEEALIHIQEVENNLLYIEKDEINRDIIDEMMRSTHSIKGAAGFFQLSNIVELAHAMESLLGKLGDKTVSISHKLIDTLLAANDCLKEMVKHVDNSNSIDISIHIGNLLYLAKNEASDDKPAAGTACRFVMDQTEILSGKDGLADKGLNIDNPGSVILEEALRHGHKLYRVSAKINEGFNGNGINIISLFKKVQSIGNIMEECSGLTSTGIETDSIPQEIFFSFLFTSVLEKSLAALALDLPENYIIELDRDIGMHGNICLQHSTQQHDSEDNPLHTRTEIIKREEAKRDEQTVVEDSVRVHTALLDDLLNLAGEMILSRNRLFGALKEYKKDIQGLDLMLKDAAHITKELQGKIMQTRMQPVANVFNKFPRIVRELSRKLGKETELQMEGQDVGLDKSIIESLIDPLTHIIRNAVDHGIEKPEVRVEAGKNRTGTILMKASHEGGYVKIDITDDGAGIDIQCIRQKAIEKGIVKNPGDLPLEGRGLLELIFSPGFSMAEEVTDISGRGVGMDVVKTNIEKLGGSVEVITSPGKGTTFKLTLPLTIAIITSLIVEVQGQKYAVPQVNLEEIIRIKPEDRQKKIENINKTMILSLRDELLPAVYLSDILGVERKDADTNSNIKRILIIRVRSGRFGLIVDTVHDSEEILVKPLPIYLKGCEFYSGVTILGDGCTAMIIDPEGIGSKADLKHIEGLDRVDEQENSKTLREEGDMQEMVLFKCSGPETFGMDFSMISRVEEIDVLTIEIVGDREYINYRGNPLRVIRPEDYLPVRRVQGNCKKAYVIIPKHPGPPFGILIEKVYDNIKARIRLNEEAIKAKGISGSCVINNKIVLLINMQELFESAFHEGYAERQSKIKETEPGQESDL